jgi:spore coat polysaccharide biosynthesis protein SpsF
LLEYLSNLHPPSYPAGNDIEVVSMETLKIAWKEALDPSEREGITRFIWTRPERFRLENLTWEGGLDLSASRGWSLRNEQDYLTIRAIFDELWTVRRPVFTLNDILSLISRHPEIVARDPGEIARRRRDSPGKPTPGRA